MKVKALTKRKLQEVYGQNMFLMNGNFRLNSSEVVPLSTLQDPIVGEVTNNDFDFGSSLSNSGNIVFEITSRRTHTQRYCVVPKSYLEDVEIEAFIDRIRPILDRQMKNRWHYEERNYALYLYYPVLTLTNSFGMSHTIHDLVVRMYVFPTQMGTSLEGIRYSFTRQELAADYSHSHLPGCHDFQSFCRGSGSDFDRLMVQVSSNFTADTFEVFLFQLDQYLRWESIEGRPHKEMIKVGSVTTFQPDSISMDVATDAAIQLLPLLTPDLLAPAGPIFIFDPSRNPEKVLEMEKQITSLPHMTRRYSQHLYQYDVSSGQYYRPTANTPSNSLPNSLPESLKKAFSIQPTLIEEEVDQKVKPVLIKRFSRPQMQKIILKVNELLLNQTKLDEQTSGTTESTNRNNEQTSQPYQSFA